MQWFDAGVNLFSPQFAGKEHAIIQRAQADGISHVLLISSDLEESHLNQAFVLTQSNCFCTAGVHPHQAARVASNWEQQLIDALQHPQVVAIGECGLDYNRDYSPRDTQQQIFATQLELARVYDKALYLHERDAFTTQIAMLKAHAVERGIAHCFTGDLAQLRTYLDLGLFIGITGWLCDERRGQDLQAAIRYLPLDRLILETDAPYLIPRNYRPRPKFNEPALLPVIAAEVSRLTGVPLAELASQCFANSLELFQIKES